MSNLKHEAFVYRWSNGSEWYVGFHIGHPNDGYICSSESVKERIETEEGWERKIIAWGTAAEMRAFETGALRALDARKNKNSLNKWNNELYYLENGRPEGHERDFVEGILTQAEVMPGSNNKNFYTIFIDDTRIHCNPEWVSEKDDARIKRQIGQKVGCTVTWRKNYAWFSPNNLNEVEE